MLKLAMRGFSIVEMMIAIGLLAVLLAMAAPSFSVFLQNTQVRNAAETTLSGLTLARAEAVRRNTAVRFSLVSDLTNACVLNSDMLNWVVSLGNPVGYCGMNPADQADTGPATSTDPKIVQKKSGQEGTRSVSVTAVGGSAVTFNGLGRLTGAGLSQLDFQAAGVTCEHAGGSVRCLRILITTGGQVKMCDPKVTVATDPRYCA